jgi:hypothetical protein
MRTQVTKLKFREMLQEQGVERDDFAFICPACKSVQSAKSLIKAGAGDDFRSVSKFLGFSCVGRFVGAGSPSKEPDGKPCNWSLGGLLHLHELEVIDEDGEAHMTFEPATAEQAQELAKQNA